MQLPPVEILITWPPGNYDHPSEVRGPTVLILTLIFVPTLLILVALRMYTRLRLTKNFGPDDIAIALAVIPTLGCAVISMLAVLYYGWDRHVWDNPTGRLSLALKLSMAVELLYSFGCSLTRLSILLLVLRVMATGEGILRRLTIFMIGLVCAEEFIFCVVALNTCKPISDYWTLSFAPQQCMNEAAHILAAGIINTITDFCVVLIPIPVVLKLKLPLRQRILCAILFGAGFIVCIAGGVRMKYTWELNNGYDKTWLFYETWICGTIELYLGIIASTIPAIKPLVVHYFPNVLGISSLNYGGHSLKYGGQSFNVHHAQNRDLFPERRSLSTPLSEVDLDYVKNPNITLKDTSSIDLENGLPLTPCEEDNQDAKSRSLILQPIVSNFSTYRKQLEDTKSATRPDPVTQSAARPTTWKNSHPPPLDDTTPPRSSRTSISSFNPAPVKHARADSEEELTGKGGGAR